MNLPEVTPWLNMKISHAGGHFLFRIFLDTGGSSSMISMDLAKLHEILILHSNNLPNFKAVNGIHISILGYVDLQVLNQSNNIELPVCAIVTNDMENVLILGYGNLCELGIIRPSFPFAKFPYEEDLTIQLNTNSAENLMTSFGTTYLQHQ